MHSSYWNAFLKKDYAVSVLLFSCAILAVLLVNSPLGVIYNQIINTPINISIGPIELHKTFIVWINDGLMGIFFLSVGLEIKQEILHGELSNAKNIILPVLGALGGIIAPSIIYAFFNYDDPIALKGWAIPAATDIAFAIGVLSLLGNKVPSSLKTFLLTLAIIDDIGAILIIAFFYTSQISVTSLLMALGCFSILTLLNYAQVTRLSWYLLIGFIMWVCLLKSGIHATLAGILIAMTIPASIKNKKTQEVSNKNSPLCRLTKSLHSKVNYIILPLFAFANSGIFFKTIGIDDFLSPISLGIIFGLFLGKQIGVIVFSYIGTKLKIASLPKNTSWFQLYGTSLLCGIGFTMSLFISSLAFEGSLPSVINNNRMGIIIGSIASAILGVIVLNIASKNKNRC